jgi:hypothetical protein
MKTFPIPTAEPEERRPVERLVEHILAAKARDADAGVSALERQIDELVFAMYDLTSEEIQLVKDQVD